MSIRVPSYGPLDAKIMIIGEAPGREEEIRLQPFVGASGLELTKMLHESGISRSECYLTNVVKFRPPGNDISEFFFDKACKRPQQIILDGVAELKKEIEQVKPKVIIALGNTPMWALTDRRGITDWRGSFLRYGEATLIPTYHPAAVLRQWDWRPVAVHDLRRARQCIEAPPSTPAYNFTIRPSLEAVIRFLMAVRATADAAPTAVPLAVDIETRGALMSCVGISTDPLTAINIPLMCVERPEGYWTLDEELIIWQELKLTLTHPKIFVIGQNFLYDAQYFARYMGFVPRLADDTMWMQHICFPGLPKGLDFLSSMYCKYHTYWKHEGKEWDPRMPEEQHWAYNCKDAVITFEVWQVLNDLIDKFHLREQYNFQMSLFNPVLRMMLRGVRIDTKLRNELSFSLEDELVKRQQFVNTAVGHDVNINSPKQLQELFYGEFSMAVINKRSTGRPTTDDDALKKFALREPVLKPLVQRINECRSIKTFLSNFVQAELGPDKRLRCSFNPAGTETYRFNSSTDAFGSGTNLQNVPRGEEEHEGTFTLPKIRRMFIPDPSYILYDADLAGADAQVVAWEANDIILKQMFRERVKIHAENAKLIYKGAAGSDGKREPYYTRAKMGVHACVDPAHEALTLTGWKSVTEIVDDEEILVCNVNGSNPRFESCSWHRQFTATTMVHLKGSAYDQLVTWDHTIPYIVNATGVKTARAQDIPKSARLLKAATINSPVNNFGRILAAFHADGSINKLQVRFHLKKKRKVKRLLALVPEAAIHGPYADSSYHVTISGDLASKLIVMGKTPTWALLQYPDIIAGYVEELTHWDGHIAATSQSFSTSSHETALIIQAMLHLTGHSGSIRPGNRCFILQINNRPLARVTKKTSYYEGMVYCPHTTTGFWLTRRAGRIGVTGNTNYGASARTVAAAIGVTVSEAEEFQRIWFSAHPQIRAWHHTVMACLQSTRSVSNKFGYRRIYFDRIDSILPEALAWIPQSTVACTINRGLVNIEKNLPSVHILLQVHDSLLLQLPIVEAEKLRPQILEQLKIVIPYEDPLVIPAGLKVSERSWGDCK